MTAFQTDVIIIKLTRKRSNRCVAQFGRALRSGRRGRKFKSCRIDTKNGYRQVSVFSCRFYSLVPVTFSGANVPSRRRGCGRPVDGAMRPVDACLAPTGAERRPLAKRGAPTEPAGETASSNLVASTKRKCRKLKGLRHFCVYERGCSSLIRVVSFFCCTNHGILTGVE